jgi:hypothetical protein
MALRLLANLAALVALAALGLAIGDFASDPNPLGALGLIALVALIVAACTRLYRPGGAASRRPARARPAAAETPEPEARPKRRRSSNRPTSAPLWTDDDR